MNKEADICEVIYSYKQYIENFCYKYYYYGDFRDIEEVVSDVLRLAIKHYHKYRGECLFKTWLTVICKNRCKYKYSLVKRRRILYSISIEDFKANDIPDNFNIYNIIEYKEFDKIGKDEILHNEELTKDHIEILKLRIIHKKTYKQIAEILNIPIGTVKSRLKRAKRELKPKLLEKIAA